MIDRMEAAIRGRLQLPTTAEFRGRDAELALISSGARTAPGAEAVLIVEGRRYGRAGEARDLRPPFAQSGIASRSSRR
jgi:hypothetical protein